MRKDRSEDSQCHLDNSLGTKDLDAYVSDLRGRIVYPKNILFFRNGLQK